MSKPQNLEANRALKAFEFAQKGNADKAINYSAAVQVLPSMIRMNGLRATMAYFYSKGSQHELVFKQLCEWFMDENEPTKFMREKFHASPENIKPAGFMNILLNLSDEEYRIVQAETLTLANWMIRFVKTDMSGNQSNTTTDDTGQP